MTNGNGKPEEQAPIRTGRGRVLPPVHSRFKPGQSGNPGGRRKNGDGLSITAILRKVLDEKVATPAGKKRVAEVLARALVRQAMNGNVRHLAAIMDRIDGPVRQEIDATVTEQVKVVEVQGDPELI